ncbi:polyphosphate synthetase Protein [Trypanosoma rangeli]|uniref:Polyphosphate synthetase Protein n=1 Tax=Trypanosoma rangeli TaxID=5698 RepID=A0A422NDG2_TRYRA|nr:polyphosphate synthetase Protein [Trypanosoma rangeli]RNF03511.1 polyphosphate synthetase Protein [Trypanosoma rangeli]|eukprot:RNF03511.1 polyphosphate synthetase Protein [Trypanosoma rangeli]
MPFSKAWRSAVYPDFREQGAYINYKATKDILHRMKEDIANPSTPDELYNSLLEQKCCVYKWCENKIKEILTVAESLMAASDYLSEEETPANLSLVLNTLGRGNMNCLPPNEARLVADAISHELLRFVECCNLNTDTIEHIIGRMYRYAVLGPTGDRWNNLKTEYDYHQLSIHEIFYLLSRVYDRVTEAESMRIGRRSGIPEGTVGSQVFDRRSVKYWVHLQDLPFVIARIIPHLPLSTFKDTYKICRERNIPFMLGSPVSSVYWDNNEFLLYHRRLERLEGATLIRMRWYSDPLESDWNKLAPTDSVFMEIKVHREAWCGERSNKRRFALKEKDVDSYVHGNLDLSPAVEKLRGEHAHERELRNFMDLSTEIVSKIDAYELKPVIRTQCCRAAFQRGIDQSIRISIDTDLRMSAEDFGLGHHWRYSGMDSPVSHFPYAVVEIKLQCAENERIAPWIEELMSCRYMESVPKFSKYAHGIASLYGHTPFIKMVPYWMHQLNIDIRASTKPEQNQWDPTTGLAFGCWERTTDRVIFGVGSAQTQTVGASEARFLPRTDYTRIYQKVLRGLRGESAALPMDADTDTDGGRTAGNSSSRQLQPQPQLPAHTLQYDVDRRHKAYTTFHLYPYAEHGVESLCFAPAFEKNSAAEVFYGRIPWQTGKRIRVPQKYDPKTLLTSERYMVKWAEHATRLGVVGLAVIQFGNSMTLPSDVSHLSSVWRAHFHIVLGTSLVAVALFTLAYAYITFKARARRVYARKKIRYDDKMGPSVLTVVLAFGICVTAMTHIMVRYGPMLTGNDDF